MGVKLRARAAEYSAAAVELDDKKIPTFKVSQEMPKGYISFPILTADGDVAVKTVSAFYFEYTKTDEETGEPYTVRRWALSPDPEEEPELFKRCCLLTSNKGNQPSKFALTVVATCNFREIRPGVVKAEMFDKLCIFKMTSQKLGAILRYTANHDWTKTDLFVTSNNPRYQHMDFTPVTQDTLFTRVGKERGCLIGEDEWDAFLDAADDLFDRAEEAILDILDNEKLEIFLNILEREKGVSADQDIPPSKAPSKKFHQQEAEEEDEDVPPYPQGVAEQVEEEDEEPEPPKARSFGKLGTLKKYKA